MELVQQSHEILAVLDAPLELIELAGRTCYKSEDKITEGSAEEFVRKILSRNPPHESVIEHSFMAVRFLTNRGVSHEMVRHRLAGYSQESTRYVKYQGGDIQFIRPVWLPDLPLKIYREPLHRYMRGIPVGAGAGAAAAMFLRSCINDEKDYNGFIDIGWRPEQAREILGNALKTEIVMSCNFREWRHVFKLRNSKKAHPMMRALMGDLHREVRELIPIIFD